MSRAASAFRAFLACSLLLFHHHCSSSMDPEAASVFEQGWHGVALSRVGEASWCSPAANKEHLPPKPLLVAAPQEAGEYPVLLFLHGYLAKNSFYSQLLHHVASHGFIAVGPQVSAPSSCSVFTSRMLCFILDSSSCSTDSSSQLYTVSGPDTTAEINAAASVIDWLAGGLPSILPPNVHANLTRMSIAGHSRGSKAAFALALGHAEFSPRLAALIAVDPVDGMGVGRQTQPPILTGRNGSLRLPAPVMVVGTGHGGKPNGPLFPPCAPPGVSHEAFFDECAGDRCHLVARDYGHTDMMDDDTPGARGLLTRALCRSGGARAPMRRFVAGATVAFLKKWTGGEGAALDGIRKRPEASPVVLSVVEFVDDTQIGQRMN
jgi:chlorophyllase